MPVTSDSTVTTTPPPNLAALVDRVDRFLAEWLSTRDLPARLDEAVRYALFAGGKRLRPVLTVLCCESVGGSIDAALPPAGAMELIHNFSLVHDDLPAMDDDELRRGRPTLHVHSGEAMAILAGDAMTSLAFELVGADAASDAQAARMTRELANATTRMIAGQVLDTLGGFPDGLTDREKLELIHHNKTGALIIAACRLGAIAGGADDAQLEAITRYARALGLMFQIMDDVLDVTQSEAHLGKATGKDEAMGKLTFPGLIGLEASRAEISRLHEAACASVADFGERASMLVEVSRYMSVRTR